MGAAELLSWLAETTLATSALIVLVLIIRRPVARRFGAEAAYLLWLAPALRFIAPTFAILPTPVTPDVAPLSDTTWRTFDAAAFGPSPVAPQFVNVEAAIVAVWAVGAVAFALWQSREQNAFHRRLIASSTDAPQGMRAEAATVAWRRGFKRRPDLRVAGDETGPLVIGLLRPIIVVPASFATRLTSHERQMALAHEFGHVARGDLAAACAALLLRALQWFNPLAHAAWRAFRADQEAACDALVLRRTADDPQAASVYAETLVKAARMPAPTFALSIAFNLKERLVLIKTPSRTKPVIARVATICAVLAGVAATASYSNAEEVKKATAQSAPKTEAVTVKRVMLIGEGEKSVGGKDKHVVVLKSRDGGRDSAKEFVFVGRDGAEADIRLLALEGADCEDAEGKALKPLIDQTSESSDGPDGEQKVVTKTIICGKDAGAKSDPQFEAEVLRKALARLQDEAKREAEHRQRAIAAIEARIAELEKKKTK